MDLYNKYILPRLLNRAMSDEDFAETRAKVIGKASGIVLEIGLGSGLNIPHYKGITKLYTLEPSRELFKMATERIKSVPFPVENFLCSAESIPLPDNSADTVVSTWTLCSIPDPAKALNEIKRVLRPGGKFVFAEHGKSTKKSVSTIQHWLTPINRRIAGNCHLDREVDELIRNSGLAIQSISIGSDKGKPLMYSFEGIAVKN